MRVAGVGTDELLETLFEILEIGLDAGHLYEISKGILKLLLI